MQRRIIAHFEHLHTVPRIVFNDSGFCDHYFILKRLKSDFSDKGLEMGQTTYSGFYLDLFYDLSPRLTGHLSRLTPASWRGST
jgi:hypothetical protein